MVGLPISLDVWDYYVVYVCDMRLVAGERQLAIGCIISYRICHKGMTPMTDIFPVQSAF